MSRTTKPNIKVTLILLIILVIIGIWIVSASERQEANIRGNFEHEIDGDVKNV